MGGVLRELCARFGKLYKRRAHLHHFTQYMDAAHFDVAHDLLSQAAAAALASAAPNPCLHESAAVQLLPLEPHQVAAEYEQVQSAAVPAEHEALLERLLPVAPPRPGAAAASAANNAG